jgi:hypothetical protein
MSLGFWGLENEFLSERPSCHFCFSMNFFQNVAEII